MWRISSSGKVAAAVCALALGLAACGGGDDDDGAEGAAPDEAALEAAVRDYWSALATGDLDSAYASLDESCRSTLTVDEFAGVWSAPLDDLLKDYVEPGPALADLEVEVSIEPGTSEDERQVQWGLVVDPASDERLRPNGGSEETWRHVDGEWFLAAPCPEAVDGSANGPGTGEDRPDASAADAELASGTAASVSTPEGWTSFGDRTPDPFHEGDELAASCDAAKAAADAAEAAAGTRPAVGAVAVAATEGVPPAALLLVFVWPDREAAAGGYEAVADEAAVACLAAGAVASLTGEVVVDASAVGVPEQPLGPAPGAASSVRAVTVTTAPGTEYDVELDVGYEGRVVAAVLFVSSDEHPLSPDDARTIGDSLTTQLSAAATAS